MMRLLNALIVGLALAVSCSLPVQADEPVSQLADRTIVALLYRTTGSQGDGLTAEEVAMVVEWAQRMESLPRFHRVIFNMVMDGRAVIHITERDGTRQMMFIILKSEPNQQSPYEGGG